MSIILIATYWKNAKLHQIEYEIILKMTVPKMHEVDILSFILVI